MNEKNNDNLDDISDLLVDVNISKKEDLKEFLENIDLEDEIFIERVKNKLFKDYGISKSTFNKVLKEIMSESTSSGLNKKLVFLQKKNPDNEYYIIDNMIIEKSPRSISLVEFNKEFLKYTTSVICDFSFEILSFCYDNKQDGIIRFIIKDNEGRLLYSYTLEEILKFYNSMIYNGIFGRDVIKKIVNYMLAKNMIEEKRPEYILGFDDGWKLPLLGKKSDFMIVVYTQEERAVMGRCAELYEKYTDDQKDEIKKDLEKFISITKIPEPFKSIIISFCIIAPFKLFFLERDGIFPTLILEGTKHTGKTSFLDFFGNYFYGHYEEHMSGQTAKSIARFEDVMSSSTFPRVIDEYNNVPGQIVDLIKEMATSKSEYKRKTSSITQFSKPKITPMLITSNDLGEFFRDSANSSRAIILNFETTIVNDVQWVNLRNKLKKKKLFSLLYEYTENWTNEDVRKLTDRALDRLYNERKFARSWKTEGLSNADVVRQYLSKYDTEYPRISKIYEILLSGALLFEEVFGIKLETKEIFGSLLVSRRLLLDDLVDKFFIFCESAIAFDPSDAQEASHRYLTHRLETIVSRRDKSKVEYVFTQNNLRDFNTFYQPFGSKKFSMRELGMMIEDALEDKNVVKYTTINFKGKSMRVILIKEEFISGRFKGARIQSIKSKKKIDLSPDEVQAMQRELVESEMRKIEKEEEEYNKMIIEALDKRIPINKIRDKLRPGDDVFYAKKLNELLLEDENDEKNRKKT